MPTKPFETYKPDPEVDCTSFNIDAKDFIDRLPYVCQSKITGFEYEVHTRKYDDEGKEYIFLGKTFEDALGALLRATAEQFPSHCDDLPFSEPPKEAKRWIDDIPTPCSNCAACCCDEDLLPDGCDEAEVEYCDGMILPEIDRVTFSGPCTIVFWADGDKTVVRCGEGEQFERYAGFCAAITKKMFGSTSAAKKFMDSVDTDMLKAQAQKDKEAALKAQHNKEINDAIKRVFTSEEEVKKRAHELLVEKLAKRRVEEYEIATQEIAKDE